MKPTVHEFNNKNRINLSKTLLLVTVFTNIFFTIAKAETEPNNTYSQANTLAVNGSDNGAVSGADLTDWWKVTTTVDGGLIVNTTSNPSVEIDLYMMDVDGTTQIATYDTGFGIHEATHYSHLMPGTYYIKVYNAGGNGNYSISSIFTAASFTADAMNNDNYSVASVLAPNGSSNGHIGYYSAGYTDLTDWYSITIPLDGKLIVNTTSDATEEIDLYMYDVNGTTQIATYDTGFGIHEATHYNNLMPGTYFVKVLNYGGYGAYTISSIFTSASFTADVMNNDSVQAAITLAPNSTSHGHCGYYSNGFTDVNDWWKITIPSDGKLIVNTTSDATEEIDLYMYDVNGTTQIATYDTSFGIHEATHYNNLMPGTYFIKVLNYGGYGAYAISSIFTSASFTADVMNNDSVQAAIVLAPNSTSHGHCGYYSNGYTDLYDWWKVTIPSDGQLIVNTTSDATEEIDLYMYDVNGVTFIATYDTGFGIHEATHYNNLIAGTYFVRVWNYGGYGAYTISSIFNAATLPNDVENNDLSATAATLANNDSARGHLRYYGDGYTDYTDWWVVSIPAGLDSLTFETISDPTLEIDFNVYLQTDLANPILIGSTFGVIEKVQQAHPVAGDYYIKVIGWSGYGTYNLKNIVSGFPASVKNISSPVISFYPNPVSRQLSVVSLQSSISSIVIINQLGQMMMSENYSSVGNEVQLNVSDFASGIYSVEVKTAEGIFRNKFVKQ